MTDSSSAAQVVATVKSCEQYRFRVELPCTLGKEIRADIRARALREVNRVFLECTRQFQAGSWTGEANLAFTDGRSNPSDSKSEFLHLLVCLMTVKLGVEALRGFGQNGGILAIATCLRFEPREAFAELAGELGLTLRVAEGIASEPVLKSPIAKDYRAPGRSRPPFFSRPAKRIDDFRGALARRLADRPAVKVPIDKLLLVVALPFWMFSGLATVAFTLWYRPRASRLLRRLDGSRNLFVYFDMRLGKDREVASYLKWKFGSALSSSHPPCIPFTHFARPGAGKCLAAMVWAANSLRNMERDSLEGCVVANYLISPLEGWRLFWRRRAACKAGRALLLRLIAATSDPVAARVYREILVSLNRTRGFSLEITAGYRRLFGAMSPGVVLQADTVAKTARHFMACAKQRGSRTIYVADRICTGLRTSNQLIADGGANLHLPDRFIVFDEVSRDEFVRQGVAPDRLYSYTRLKGGPVTDGEEAGADEVLILLQAYEDNIGGMVELGAEILRSLSGLQVVYQEHPNFSVKAEVKERLAAEFPGRLRFLQKGESAAIHRLAAMVTGYSTAAVPGVLQGVPLIWLREQVDNSIFCETLFDRIGFAASDSSEVVALLASLREREPDILRQCLLKAAETREIFMSRSVGDDGNFEKVLARAVADSFGEVCGGEAHASGTTTSLNGERVAALDRSAVLQSATER